MTTLQVTMLAGATQASGVDVYCAWIQLQNNSAHTLLYGDSTVGASNGQKLTAGSTVPLPFPGSPRGLMLSQLYLYTGNAGDVIDILYEPA